MFHKNILIFLSLIIRLTSGLKSTDFCILKQKECKGYYDKQQQENYQIKCNPIKCNGKLSYECESNARICSLDKKECTDYYNFKFFSIHLKLTTKIQSFNKEIKYCQKKIYKLPLIRLLVIIINH